MPETRVILSARGLRKRFEPAGLVVERSQIAVHEADEPDAVVNLSDADGLAGEDGAEIDFALFVTDSAASGEGDVTANFYPSNCGT